MRHIFFLGAGAIALLVGTPAVASETIKYSYDVHGRLVKVERSGTVNDGVVTTYGYDKVDNRLNKSVTGPAGFVAGNVDDGTTGQTNGEATWEEVAASAGPSAGEPAAPPT